VSTPVQQAPQEIGGDSRPYLALGLTFLLLGIGFANPFALVPSFPRGMWEGQLSRETLNLYALTAFLGWAHFAYAWRGQWHSSTRMAPKKRNLYWLTVALLLVVLLAARSLLGTAVFSLITWVYNISHFIKAETFFAGRTGKERKTSFFAPAIAFAWFTLVLFRVGPLNHLTLVFVGTLALAATSLLLGDWRALANNQLRLPLLTLFFLGETLIWSAYGPYMTPAFRVGVYVLHIAAASFFHYLSSYLFAQRRASASIALHPLVILAVNLCFVALGCAATRLDILKVLRFILAPEWFTLWVALHLAASDLLPAWKRRTSVHPSR